MLSGAWRSSDVPTITVREKTAPIDGVLDEGEAEPGFFFGVLLMFSREVRRIWNGFHCAAWVRIYVFVHGFSVIVFVPSFCGTRVCWGVGHEVLEMLE